MGENDVVKKMLTDLPYLLSSHKDDPSYLGKENITDRVRFHHYTLRSGALLVESSNPSSCSPRPFTLNLFGEVSKTNFLGTPCGNYTPGTANPENVSEAEIRFYLKKPTDKRYMRMFVREWEKYTDNLRAIHRMAYQPDNISDAMRNSGQHVTQDHEIPDALFTPIVHRRIALTHKLFAPKERLYQRPDLDPIVPRFDNSVYIVNIGTVQIYSDPAEDPLTFDGWPVKGMWREEMEKYRDILEIQPLPAMTSLDNEYCVPVEPSEYATLLPGSLVLVSLCVTCDTISHTMTLHIAKMEILICKSPRSLRAPRERRLRAKAYRSPTSSDDNKDEAEYD